MLMRFRSLLSTSEVELKLFPCTDQQISNIARAFDYVHEKDDNATKAISMAIIRLGPDNGYYLHAVLPSGRVWYVFVTHSFIISQQGTAINHSSFPCAGILGPALRSIIHLMVVMWSSRTTNQSPHAQRDSI
jgi:hypothetical protein